MKIDRILRLVAGIAILAVFVIAAGALLFVTESALNVWDRLLEGPRVFLYVYGGLLLAFAVAALFLVWRLLVRREPTAAKRARAPVMTQDDIEGRIREAEAAGVDVESARAELEGLAERDSSVHLCFFGEVSKGKSSLVRALVPEADVETDVLAGSTGDIRHFSWQTDSGATVMLTDVPGLGGHEDGLDSLAVEEARRAQLVLFICDGDLNRAEMRALEALLELAKPLVLVLNKADQFSAEERATLMQQLLEKLEALGSDEQRDRVVAVTAGGEVEVVERDADGRERRTRRSRDADIGVLVVAIRRLLDEQGDDLDQRRNRAVFALAEEKLVAAESRYRQQRSEQIIRNSTRKAIVGSLAAVSPGTDIVIQGYIGTAMTRELCELYGAAPRDLDIEQFLDLSQSRVGKALPIVLAVAGNGLKAFPGIGTVAGGLVHAVAYGLIFDALGRSLVLTLNRHGELDPGVAASAFEEGLSEHIEAHVRRIARLAVDNKKD